MKKIVVVLMVCIMGILNMGFGECADKDDLKEVKDVNLKVGTIKRIVLEKQELGPDVIRLSAKGYETRALIRIYDDYLTLTTIAPTNHNPKATSFLVFKVDDKVLKFNEIGERNISSDFIFTGQITERLYYDLPDNFINDLEKAKIVGFRLEQCEVKKTEELTPKAVKMLSYDIEKNRKLCEIEMKARHRALSFKDRILLLQGKKELKDCQFDEEKAVMYFNDMRKKADLD